MGGEYVLKYDINKIMLVASASNFFFDEVIDFIKGINQMQIVDKRV